MIPSSSPLSPPSSPQIHLKALLLLLQNSRTLCQMLQIHAQLITSDTSSNSFILNQLLISATSLNPPLKHTNYPTLIFHQIPHPTTCTFNTMIKHYTNLSSPHKALSFYISLKRNGFSGDNYTYPFVLKACRLGLGFVRQVHGEIVKTGHGCDAYVVNSLIGVYGKFGELGCARMVFGELGCKDLVSWNQLLIGYVRNGEIELAQGVFDELPQKDVCACSVMIDAYGKIGDVVRARILFDSMPNRDLISWNSIIAGYVKAGDLESARQLFDASPEKNVISWSTLLDGYASHGKPQEALLLFRQMLCQGVKVDSVSMVSALSSCAQLGALLEGRWIHMYMKKNEIVMDIVVQTALLDMYMKCGSIDEAYTVFASMSERNVVSYCVMISGFGMHGYVEEALKYYNQMILEGIPADDMIFIGLLTACGHAGFVNEGLCIFNQMKGVHGIEPKLEHYDCLVNLTARAGQLNHARLVIESMPLKPSASLWTSLLLACRTHQDVTLAEVSIERLRRLKADDTASYIVLANTYSDAGLWEEARRIRRLVEKRIMSKEIGKSVI